MDVTERKRAEELLEAAQAEIARVARITTVGELAASIAHEVNQPLTAVLANSEAALRWLARKPPNLKETRAAVKRIVRDAGRAGDVIKHIRALLQKDRPQHVDLDLNDAIREVLTLTRGEQQRRGVSVETKLFPRLPRVRGDRIQLQQVILNLVVNGIEAMGAVSDRPRTLHIRTEVAEHDDALVAFEDSGVGLDPDMAERIFEPFFTTKPSGMGMGLSISRSIVELHEGRLWAAPASPHGTVVQFKLPSAQGDAS
jgi:C4-dicarboxylate-specific signal transduction histidine kinase